MMKIALTLLVSIISFGFVGAQTIDSDSIQQKMNVKSDGDSMCSYFLYKDFNNFIRFTYPKLLEMYGGKEKLLGILDKGTKEMEASKEAYLKVEIGEPSTILSVGDELQCTLPQTIELRQATGKAIIKTTLIAISANKGLSWYFIDTHNNNITNMQGYLPNLSSKLVLPKTEKPEFIPD